MKRTVLPESFVRSEDLSKIIQSSVTQHHSNWKIVLLHVGVGIVAGISPITYVKPSYADTPPYGLPDHSSIRVMQVISTWAATTALLYLACSDFMTARVQNAVPVELTDIVEGLSKKQIRRQDWVIGAISMASAIPLTTPLVKFPLISTGDSKIDVPGNIGLVSVILISNSIAHLRPLQLIMNDPWYGAPFTLIKFIKNKFQERRMSAWDKHEKNRQAHKIQNNMHLKNNFIKVLQSNSERMIDECFVFKKAKLGYHIELTNHFEQVNELTGDDFIFSIVDAHLKNPDVLAVSSQARQVIYNLYLHLPAHFAGILALAESLGYLADSGFEFDKLTGIPTLGWALAAVPIYAFGVLIHNAARAQTQDVLDFLSGFFYGNATLSWPIKYCARTFFGLLSIPSLAILLLNSSAANTMIRTDFGEYCSDNFINKYISISRWGYVWLATLLVVNTEKYLFSKWAKYFGNHEAKQIAVFSEKIQDISMRISQWKPERFEAWLAQQTPEFRRQALNLTEAVYLDLTEDIDSKNVINMSPRVSPSIVSSAPSCWRFFGTRSTSENLQTSDYQLLEDAINNPGNLQAAPVRSSWRDTLCFWRKCLRGGGTQAQNSRVIHSISNVA